MSTLISRLLLPTGPALTLHHGDLTEARVEAIVNAANERLAHGGGLAAAIVRRGGAEIQAESTAWVRQQGPAGHDRPALTGAGRLPCRYVIHAVGPVWQGGGHAEAERLHTAYTAALALADAHRFATVAFPSLSTGIFGYPVARAAPIAVKAVLTYCAAHPAAPFSDLRFTLIDAPTVQAFREVLAGLGATLEGTV